MFAPKVIIPGPLGPNAARAQSQMPHSPDEANAIGLRQPVASGLPRQDLSSPGSFKTGPGRGTQRPSSTEPQPVAEIATGSAPHSFSPGEVAALKKLHKALSPDNGALERLLVAQQTPGAKTASVLRPFTKQEQDLAIRHAVHGRCAVCYAGALSAAMAAHGERVAIKQGLEAQAAQQQQQAAASAEKRAQYLATWQKTHAQRIQQPDTKRSTTTPAAPGSRLPYRP